MIYFLAHWDWILERSRADIVTNIKDEFQITSICPLMKMVKKLGDLFQFNKLEYFKGKNIGYIWFNQFNKNFKQY